MRKVLILSIVILFAACESKDETTAKQEKLTKLRVEFLDIQNQISALEKEITKSNTAKGTETFKIPVSIKQIKTESFNHYLEISGSIEAIQNAYISPETGGQIKEIYVKEGERVKKGQVLVKLSTLLIEKGINEVETSLKLATTVFKKQQNLWDQKIGSEIDYLTTKNNKESLESKLELLNAQLDLAYIKAPFDGIIDDIMQKVGELSSPGVRLMNLINLDALYINADIAETYLPILKKGEKVELRYSSFPELNTLVPIHRIGNTIHPMNRTVNVQLKIKNSQEKLKPNGLAIIRINDFSTNKAFVVPSIIIKQDLQGSFLYVVKKANKKWIAKKCYVKTGRSYKEQTLIKGGLELNDKVVIEGYNQVSDGSEIKFI
jgi:RND family efflux transporter MFP subunit